MFLLTAGLLEFETFSFRTVNPIRSKKDPEDMARDNPFIAALSFWDLILSLQGQSHTKYTNQHMSIVPKNES